MKALHVVTSAMIKLFHNVRICEFLTARFSFPQGRDRQLFEETFVINQCRHSMNLDELTLKKGLVTFSALILMMPCWQQKKNCIHFYFYLKHDSYHLFFEITNNRISFAKKRSSIKRNSNKSRHTLNFLPTVVLPVLASGGIFARYSGQVSQTYIALTFSIRFHGHHSYRREKLFVINWTLLLRQKEKPEHPPIRWEVFSKSMFWLLRQTSFKESTTN